MYGQSSNRQFIRQGGSLVVILYGSLMEQVTILWGPVWCASWATSGLQAANWIACIMQFTTAECIDHTERSCCGMRQSWHTAEFEEDMFHHNEQNQLEWILNYTKSWRTRAALVSHWMGLNLNGLYLEREEKQSPCYNDIRCLFWYLQPLIFCNMHCYTPYRAFVTMPSHHIAVCI